MGEKKYILSKDAAEKKLRRMALEVVENNYDEPELILIGILDNGIVIAHKVREYLQEVFNGEVKVIELSMNKKKPGDITLNPSPDINGKVVILIDDVANSGSTMLYALKPLLANYPKKIQTLALVERTYKSFPVNVDYVGLSISTTPDEYIFVEVEANEIKGALIEAPAAV
ncbi:MAG: phosphoribosyltransferase family protein [Bacteroidota bacterium]|nr:phosphoribosyltransferase family protein [Ferruginibacter sp.]